ncbi:MAG: hypothetical protein ACNI27_11045 [Desulfovibrio sp.]
MGNEWKQFDTYGRVCIWAGVAVAVLFGICCIYNYESGSIYEVAEKVGSFIAGTSGVLWALAGVFFFISALRLQHEALLTQQTDLQLQRDDMKLQLDVMKEQQHEAAAQRQVFEQQQFETTFFNLIAEVRNCLPYLDSSDADPHFRRERDIEEQRLQDELNDEKWGANLYEWHQCGSPDVPRGESFDKQMNAWKVDYINNHLYHSELPDWTGVHLNSSEMRIYSLFSTTLSHIRNYNSGVSKYMNVLLSVIPDEVVLMLLFYSKYNDPESFSMLLHDGVDISVGIFKNEEHAAILAKQ